MPLCKIPLRVVPPRDIDTTLTVNLYTSSSPSLSTGSYPSLLGVSHTKFKVSPADTFIGEPKLIETEVPIGIEPPIFPDATGGETTSIKLNTAVVLVEPTPKFLLKVKEG